MSPTSEFATNELARTRNAVVNVLVGIAAMIALSGWLIRLRAQGPVPRPSPGWHDALMLGLLATSVASYLIRRRWTRWATSLSTVARPPDFHRSHVAAAVVGALGVPIGLVYGWFVDPSFDGVAPFWVVPMAMGLLAIPRKWERGPRSSR